MLAARSRVKFVAASRSLVSQNTVVQSCVFGVVQYASHVAETTKLRD